MTHSNPYTPGAGFMPSYLAGREGLISHAEQSLLALQKRYPYSKRSINPKRFWNLTEK